MIRWAIRAKPADDPVEKNHSITAKSIMKSVIICNKSFNQHETVLIDTAV